MIPIQFEYEMPVPIHDKKTDSYLMGTVKKFVVVLNVFKHHYTGGLMYQIRQDCLWHDGDVMSDEMILTEDQMMKLLSMRVDG